MPMKVRYATVQGEVIAENRRGVRKLYVPDPLAWREPGVRTALGDRLGRWRLDIEQSIELSKMLKPLGADAIDCFSGGAVPGAAIPAGPGYQTAFAERIRREAGILTAAVGLITSREQADHIVRTGQADMVLLARQMLRNPYWPLHAAKKLGYEVPVPPQYARAW